MHNVVSVKKAYMPQSFFCLFFLDDMGFGKNLRSSRIEELMKIKSHHNKITCFVTIQDYDSRSIGSVFKQARFILLMRKGYENFVHVFWRLWRKQPSRIRDAMTELGKLKDVNDGHQGQLLGELDALNRQTGVPVVPPSDYIIIDRSNRDYGQELVVKTGVLPDQQPVVFLHTHDE